MSIEGIYDDANIFAKIVRGEAPAVKVHETESVIAFMDIFPQSTGHVLVIPKAGAARNIFDIEPAALSDLMHVVQRVAKAARAALQPDGVIVLQANGQAAGQTVYHLHFHVIPCWAGQPLKGHGHGEMAAIDDLRKLAETIAASLED
ncbi:MAG TPA: HIT family protein [Aliidongia sp.]|nr:HIT family protein [Aliidongia sp.]